MKKEWQNPILMDSNFKNTEQDAEQTVMYSMFDGHTIQCMGILDKQHNVVSPCNAYFTSTTDEKAFDQWKMHTVTAHPGVPHQQYVGFATVS